jgi:hypothetical protein
VIGQEYEEDKDRDERIRWDWNRSDRGKMYGCGQD